MHKQASVPRRAWLVAMGAVSIGVLGGCAAAPSGQPAPAVPAAPTGTDTRAPRLEQLGFRRTDAGWEFSLTGKLLFDSDSDALDAQSQATAERLARALVELGVVQLRVEGHTDSTGSEAYNHALSLRRAQAVARAMAGAGLQTASIQAVGLGKAAPLNDNRTPEQRQQNRRVAIVLPAQ